MPPLRTLTTTNPPSSCTHSALLKKRPPPAQQFPHLRNMQRHVERRRQASRAAGSDVPAMSKRLSLLAPSTSPHPGCPCRSRPAGRTPPQRPSAGWAPSAGCPCRRCARGRASAAAAEGRRAGGRALPAWRRGWVGSTTTLQQVRSERRGGETQGAPGLSGARARSRLAALQPCHRCLQTLIAIPGWRWPGTGRLRACMGCQVVGPSLQVLAPRASAPSALHPPPIICHMLHGS